MENLIKRLHRKLIKLKLRLATAESCTGGLVSFLLTSQPGSSAYFQLGIVAYSNAAKLNILSVSEKTLKKYGAVSGQTACEMAKNARRLANSDIGISITGIAGPSGGTKEKPKGTCFVGVATSSQTKAEKFIFSGSRNQIRKKATLSALRILERLIKEIEEDTNAHIPCHRTP